MKQSPSFLLRLVYYSYFSWLLRNLCKRQWCSRLAGWYANKRLSALHIKPFIRTHDIDMTEAAQPYRYRNFNDFFVRTLKPEVRPIDQNTTSITSPVDGALRILDLSTDNYCLIKNKRFTLPRLLNNPSLAREYSDSLLLIFRLAPWDYHRFHFPVACQPSRAVRINGFYDSVHPCVFSTGAQPLTENERQLITLTMDNGTQLLMIAVGALCVGKIVQTYSADVRYAKGAEAGYFCFGGSTVLLIVPKNIITILPAWQQSHVHETPVRMGQALGLLVQTVPLTKAASNITSYI